MTPPFTLRKNFIGLLVLVNLIALPPIFFLNRAHWLHFQGGPQGPELPVYGHMPAFELTEKSGRTVTDAQLRGGVWVADFVFTRCPNQCPLMSAKFSLLQKTLPGPVRLVSFSVDPEYDTPDKLRAYAKSYGAEEGRWLFLTGKKNTIDAILRALHLGNGDDPGMHSLRFVLLDEKLQARGYYNSEDPESTAQLRRDIEAVKKTHG